MTRTREIYRLEKDGRPLLRVTAEAAPWAPSPSLNAAWLRWVLAGIFRAAA